VRGGYAAVPKLLRDFLSLQVTAYFIYTSEPETDRFTFTLYLPESFDIGSEMEFAVCFDAGSGTVYWDNNAGENYRVKCLTQAAYSSPYGCSTVPPPLRPWQQLI